jgi:hypothetical protein
MRRAIEQRYSRRDSTLSQSCGIPVERMVAAVAEQGILENGGGALVWRPLASTYARKEGILPGKPPFQTVGSRKLHLSLSVLSIFGRPRERACIPTAAEYRSTQVATKREGLNSALPSPTPFNIPAPKHGSLDLYSHS